MLAFSFRSADDATKFSENITSKLDNESVITLADVENIASIISYNREYDHYKDANNHYIWDDQYHPIQMNVGILSLHEYVVRINDPKYISLRVDEIEYDNINRAMYYIHEIWHQLNKFGHITLNDVRKFMDRVDFKTSHWNLQTDYKIPNCGMLITSSDGVHVKISMIEDKNKLEDKN